MTGKVRPTPFSVGMKTMVTVMMMVMEMSIIRLHSLIWMVVGDFCVTS